MGKQLPLELWRLVGGNLGAVEDLVALCSSCRTLRGSDTLLFSAWLARLPVQHPHIVAHQTLGFLNACVNVLVKACVSLTVEALQDGTERWWLTAESGRGPLCWQEEAHTERSCGGRLVQAPCKSYLVVKAALGAAGAVLTRRWKFVAFARLSPDSLGKAGMRIVRHLRALPSMAQDCTRRGEAVQELFSRLDAGLFALPGHPCTCAVANGVICSGCHHLSISERQFVVQDRFLGYDPRGLDHWFSGVTDAVGDVAHMQLPWLACCCGVHLPTCVVL